MLLGKGLGKAVFSLVALIAAGQASAFVLGPTTPGKWGSATMGTGATVTYSYMADGVGCAEEFAGCTISAIDSFMGAGATAAIDAAFDAWSAVADITFINVADQGEDFNAVSQLSGDIRLGGHLFDGAGGTLAHGFFPPANGSSAAGDIHFDIAELWKTGLGGAGFNIFQVAAHEIGHAIGLGHSNVANSLMGAFYTEAFSGLQQDDIEGAQFIYGAPNSVPEPLTGALMLVGLAMVGVRGRRSIV